jgi:hypothetical protein
MTEKNSNIVIYQTEDGKTKIETRLEEDTVWLTIDQMAELFQKSRSTINEHILNIYEEQELDSEASMRKIGNSDFSTKPTNFYNLDVIISVGYRVKSPQGTKFRQWATARLKEYIVKGFAMNDELLKQAGGGKYFDELLARIRDIRSSEKVFWRKVLDIYSTSVDYDPKLEISVQFFQTVQNKMHFAAHGHTAAEIIYDRIDGNKPNAGLMHFKGNKPTKQEAEIAKNYLSEDELGILNRMVNGYLELAEIQALNRKPMYMKDWIEKLDEFVKVTGRDILQNAGKISHEKALKKAAAEYDKYKERTKNELSEVEKHFIEQIEATSKKLDKKKIGKTTNSKK